MRYLLFGIPACVGALLLSACDAGNETAALDLQGRFVGSFASGASVAVQVVAEIPGVRNTDLGAQLEFQFYPVLASAKPVSFSTEIQSNGDVLVRIGTNQYKLSRKDACATSGDSKTSLCWAAGKIDFNGAGADGTALTLHLERAETLAAAAPGAVYSLDDLMGRAKFQSYAVVQDAEKLFQARQQIQAAIGNLLPHFNARDALSFVTSGPLGLIDAVGDLLPFLFPSSWYQWKEAGHLASAEEKSFASMRGNEMNGVEILFYQVSRDQAVLELMKKHVSWLQAVQKSIAAQELAGAIAKGSADYFGTSVVEIEQDEAPLSQLIAEELAQLAQATALPPIGALSAISPVELPDMTQAHSVDAAIAATQATQKSLELASMSALLQASEDATGDSQFGFLDPESQDSIGFGYPSTIAIGKSHEREIQDKITETSSLLAMRCSDISSEMTGSIDGFQAAQTGGAESLTRFQWLWQRKLSGDVTLSDQDFLDGLVDLQKKVMVFRASKLSGQYEFLAAQSKLNRILLLGPYSDLEGGIPSPSGLK